jgi:hypothetical protein
MSLQIATAEKLAELTKQDPSNKEWKVVETTNLLHLGDTLLRMNSAMDALQRLETAFNKMAVTTPGASADADRRMALGLILLAQTRKALGEKEHEECRKAVQLLEPIRSSDPTNDYTQDLWTRAHLCLGQRDLVQESIAWLAQIGYRRSDYLRSLSQNTN